MAGPLASLFPELVLALGGLAILLGDAFFPRHDKLWLSTAAASVIAALVGVFTHFTETSTVLNMIAIDPFGSFLKTALLGAVLIVIGLSYDYSDFYKVSMGVYASTLLFSTIGLLLLVCSTDLLLILIALELLGIGSFVLTGYLPQQLRSSEGAIKFFLFGSLSTAIFTFGLSYYYGLFGTTALSPLSSYNAGPTYALLLSLLFLLAGLGFKLAMVPFHMWVPDAYEGAPTPITAFLSVAPKVAALGALIRIFSRHAELGLTPILAILAALTMTVGNVGALKQTNVKRLLAYSSIAQVGYILVGFVAAGPLGYSGALLYAGAYLFMNLGAFACVIAVSNSQGSDDLQAYAGISMKSLPFSLAFIIFLLSLTGIPPLFGFIGKFSVFAAALSNGWVWLAVVGVLNSVISLYYYFRIAQQMYFQNATTPKNLTFSPALLGGLVLSLIITIGFGLLPNTLMTWTQSFFR